MAILAVTTVHLSTPFSASSPTMTWAYTTTDVTEHVGFHLCLCFAVQAIALNRAASLPNRQIPAFAERASNADA
jgi:hypothetical protein